MTQAHKEKIRRFLADKTMSEAVFQVLLDSFLEVRKGSDVQTLAASMIAVEKLREGWKDLEIYKSETESEKHQLEQVGL